MSEAFTHPPVAAPRGRALFAVVAIQGSSCTQGAADGRRRFGCYPVGG